MQINDILNNGTDKQKRALFSFNKNNTNEQIYVKFNLWSRHFFGRYFKSNDAAFHKDIDMGNIDAYIFRGEDDGINQFVDIAFRGAAKTARTKLFLAFAIANDLDHYRRFIRCLSADLDNAKQSVTDIFNMLIQPKVVALYPEIWEKNETKREETMSSFTTSTGVKIIAKQIGVEQRGKIQDDAKADFDWYDDIETKSTIRSAVTTKKIGENMEEARTGLAKDGASIYTANYFSENGNVDVLVNKKAKRKRVLIVPIIDDDDKLTWGERYTKAEVKLMEEEDEDFAGERLCKPSQSKDVYFERAVLDKMQARKVEQDIGGFYIFEKFKHGDRYGSGHDVAGGVGLDSSTSVFINFSTTPARVVATFESNEVQPEAFGDEIYNQGLRYGLPIQAPENNKYDQAVLKAKQLGATIYKSKSSKPIKAGYRPADVYGWNTNGFTKSRMFSDLKTAIEKGWLELSDERLIYEAKRYSKNDLIDNEPDIRMTTRHFDLLIACAIAWQMKNHAFNSELSDDDDDIPGQSNQQARNPAL